MLTTCSYSTSCNTVQHSNRRLAFVVPDYLRYGNYGAANLQRGYGDTTVKVEQSYDDDTSATAMLRLLWQCRCCSNTTTVLQLLFISTTVIVQRCYRLLIWHAC